MKRILIGAGGILLAIGLLGGVVMRVPALQDMLLARGIDAAMNRTMPPPPAGGLRVFMCGTSSPLPAPGRAQACVAVQAGDRLFLVDTGAGSANVATLAGLPLQDLHAVFLTHFHSDHIAALPDFNMNSWVAGRDTPLQVYGPEGVQQVVAGFNAAYRLDGYYRVEHHGAALLPPELHDMVPRPIGPGVVYDQNALVVTAFPTDHRPVAPTLGYRFDYGGRSVVITGDTVVTPAVEKAADGADLVLSDAMSLTIVQTMEAAAKAGGRDRIAKVLGDIQGYHASTKSLAGMLKRIHVGQLALYHLVPAPRNAIMTEVFERDLPASVVLTEDGMTFDLPTGTSDIHISD